MPPRLRSSEGPGQCEALGTDANATYKDAIQPCVRLARCTSVRIEVMNARDGPLCSSRISKFTEQIGRRDGRPPKCPNATEPNAGLRGDGPKQLR